MSNREAEPPRQPGPSRPTGRLKTMLLREDFFIAIMSGMLAWVITLGVEDGLRRALDITPRICGPKSD